MLAGVDRRDVTIAAAIAAGLMVVYLATFVGQIHSVDELALFGMTERMAQFSGPPNTLVRFAEHHNPVGALEPGYAFLAAPLYALGRAWPGVSNLHAVMLLNPLLIALNAAALFLLARQLNYSRAAALVLALAFGLGTLAWPYAKSFLREPAVALLFTLAFMGLAEVVRQPTWRSIGLTLVPLLIAPTIKLTSLVMWPVVLAVLGGVLLRAGRLRWPVLLLCLGLGLAASVMLGLWLLPLRGIDAQQMLASFLANPFDPASLIPFYGLFLSPGKSIFLYMPVLLVSVAGAWAFARRHLALAAGIGLALIATLLSLRHTMWWGGLTWGPRFLLPLVPVMLLPALELWPRRKWALGLAALSVGYQTLAALTDWSKIYSALLSYYTDDTLGLHWSAFQDSPALQLLTHWKPRWLEMIWIYPTETGVYFDWKWASVLVAALGLTAWALWKVWRGQHNALWLSGLTLAALAPFTLARAYHNWPEVDKAQRLADAVNLSPYAPQTLLYVSPDIGTYHWLGLLKGRTQSIWLSPAETTAAFDSALLPVETGARLVALVDRPHIASLYPGDELVSWLNTRAYRLDSEWVDGYEAFYYAAFPAPARFVSVEAVWPTGVRLTSIAVPDTVARNAALPVTLNFACETEAWESADELFVNLIGPEGVVLTGQQGQLQYGNLASAGWQAGQSAEEKRGVWLPASAPPGTYTVLVGFANAQGFVPATLPDGSQVDYLSAATVVVAP